MKGKGQEATERKMGDEKGSRRRRDEGYRCKEVSEMIETTRR